MSVECRSSFDWSSIEYLSSKRSLYRPIISLSSSTVNRDSNGNVPAMYRWTVGRVSVTCRWYIGRASAPTVQLWQSTDMSTESRPTYRLTPPVRHKIQRLRCFGSQTSSWETVVTELQPANLETGWNQVHVQQYTVLHTIISSSIAV